MEAVTDFIFLDSKVTAGSDCTHEIKSSLFLERKALTNLDSILKGRDMTLLTKAHMVKAKGFPVVMYGCESWIKVKKKKGWMPKNWCFWTVVLEKTIESPLECKEIKPVDPRGNPPWIFIERTDSEAEAEAPILWSPNGKNWLIGKDPDAGKDWK